MVVARSLVGTNLRTLNPLVIIWFSQYIRRIYCCCRKRIGQRRKCFRYMLYFGTNITIECHCIWPQCRLLSHVFHSFVQLLNECHLRTQTTFAGMCVPTRECPYKSVENERNGRWGLVSNITKPKHPNPNSICIWKLRKKYFCPKSN